MRKIPPFLLILAVFSSCSTTRILQEGEYRLVKNNIIIEDAPELSASDVSGYVKQQTNSFYILGWNPFVSIYNWSDGSDGFFSKLWRKVGEPPIVFNSSLVAPSCRNIEDHLEYIGYYGSTVEPRVVSHGRKVYVDYVVHPGKRLSVDSVSYELPEDPDFAREFYADTLNSLVRARMTLSEDILEKESARGTSYFKKKGYYDFNKNLYSFSADTISVPGKTLLKCTVADGSAKYRFGDVTISHPASIPFKQKILTDMNLVHPGAIYDEDAVSNTYARLSALRVFNGVSVRLTPVADSNKVDCNISLSGSQTKGFKVNLEASTNSSGLIGISPQLTFYHKNIFHGGEWLSLNFSGNFQTKLSDPSIKSVESGVSASISFPKMLGATMRWFRGPNVPRTEINAAFNYQNRPEYTRSIGTFAFGYSGSAYNNTHIYKIYPLQINYVDLRDIDPDFNKTMEKNPYMRYSYQDHLDAGIGGTFLYTTNNDIVPMTPYWYFRAYFDLSGNVLSLFKDAMKTNEAGEAMLFNAPYAQYVRGEFNLGKVFRWGRNDGQSLAFRMLAGAGYAYNNSSALPFEKQFYCGGASSMRGWQTRTLGPGNSLMDNTFSIPSQTGDMKLEADLEYRFNLVWKVEGALFAEAGNVWKMSELPADFASSIAADWGIGIRVNLDFILLRIDGGFKVHDPSLPEGSRWLGPGKWFASDGYAVHFGVGYPF